MIGDVGLARSALHADVERTAFCQIPDLARIGWESIDEAYELENQRFGLLRVNRNVELKGGATRWPLQRVRCRLERIDKRREVFDGVNVEIDVQEEARWRSV